MPRKANDIRHVLSRKGFSPAEGDHTFFFLMIDGQKSGIRTKISHGNMEYDERLLSFIARQLYLSNKELTEYLDCTVTYDNYIDILESKSIIKRKGNNEQKEGKMLQFNNIIGNQLQIGFKKK